jgi:Skp family chaperone for outer membrane proteins
MKIAPAYRPTNPNAARYDKLSDLPQPPTTDPDYDEGYRLHFEARAETHSLRAQVSSVEREIREADQNYLAEAAEDVMAGKPARKDKRPGLSKRREELVGKLAVARQVQNTRADELDAIIAANREDWLEREREKRRELAERLSDAIEQVVSISDEVLEVAALVSWINGGKLHAKPFCTREINALRKAVADLIEPPRRRYVDSRGMAALQQGREATTLDGEVLPAGTSPASVTLSHSPHGLQESPLAGYET